MKSLLSYTHTRTHVHGGNDLCTKAMSVRFQQLLKVLPFCSALVIMSRRHIYTILIHYCYDYNTFLALLFNHMEKKIPFKIM